jgi:Leucine-rich repeat (LRR) protein
LTGLESLSQSLRTLRLINCQLTEIDKVFNKLKNLEVLSLAENNIRLIRNLHNCINLKKLFLYSNQIFKLEYLQDCIDLEELDLSDNLIIKVENLDALPHLWNLNLSANKIDSLNNLNNIKYISSLRELRFDDENFWPNPVCDNYEFYFDYVLKIKPNLTILDSIQVKSIDISRLRGESSFEIFSRKLNKYKEGYDKKYFQNLKEIKVNEIKIKNVISKVNNHKESLENDYQNFLSDLYESNLLKFEKKLDEEINYYEELGEKKKILSDTLLNEKTQEFEKKNNFLCYFKTLLIKLNDINETRKNHSEKLKNRFQILNIDFIYSFYQKLFPPYYSEIFNAFPLIVLKFRNNFDTDQQESDLESESYMEFCKYKINIKSIDEVMLLIIEGFQSVDDTSSISFYEIKEKSQELNNKDNYAIIFSKNSEIMYVCLFFNLIILDENLLEEVDLKKEMIGNHLTENPSQLQAKDKIYEKNQRNYLYNMNNFNYEQKNGIYGIGLQDESLHNVFSLLEKEANIESLDSQITIKELSIEEISKINKELLSNVFSLIN